MKTRLPYYTLAALYLLTCVLFSNGSNAQSLVFGNEKTKEDLFVSIDDVSTSLSKFISDVNKEGNKLMDNMQSVSDQLFKLINLMINTVNKLSFNRPNHNSLHKVFLQEWVNRDYWK